MFRKIFFVGVFCFVIFSSGCTIMAPKYSPSMQNVQTLKNAGTNKVNVGVITDGQNPKLVDNLSIRANPLKSPYNGSYGQYLADALRQELTLAGRLDPNTNVDISGVLIKNEVDAAGISTNSGDISARFVVKRAGNVIYDQVKSTHLEWDSSFFGNIAIPKAQEHYPLLVQALLAKLYSDKLFMQALQ